MSLVKCTPMRGLRLFDDDIERWFESFFPPAMRGFGTAEGQWSPAVDLTETPDEYIVKAELPGMKQDDIDVTLIDQTLTVSGEKKVEKEEKEKDYHRVERYFGKFQRSFHLPLRVDSEKIKATYKDGVLEVNLPKSADARKKEITIEVK